MNWKKRREILKKNGWEYDRSSEMWNSSTGSCDFVYDLKRYGDEEFMDIIELNTLGGLKHD